VRVFGVIVAADYELGFHAGAERRRVVLWLEEFLLPLQKIVRQRVDPSASVRSNRTPH
jgi:hypothetical protein